MARPFHEQRKINVVQAQLGEMSRGDSGNLTVLSGRGRAFVTPFLKRGTVEDLAGFVGHLDVRPEVLDELFRGRFAE